MPFPRIDLVGGLAARIPGDRSELAVAVKLLRWIIHNQGIAPETLRRSPCVTRSPKTHIIPAMREAELVRLWEEHTSHEFVTRNPEATLATMVEDAYVNHVPVLTGGFGKKALRTFYSHDFIPGMPPDTTLTPVSRTVGEDQLVDEMIFSFTHTQEIPWMLPGIAPTGRHVEVPLVAIVRFREGKLAHEHIYWDQASVLKQLGLLIDPRLPVFGAETARKVLDPKFDPQSTRNS
jgi:carboxymethylenebutenolidase